MKISVITAAFNSSATIADTLRSVLGQTWENVEHIIVDGASTDNTIDIVNSFKKQYSDSGKSLRCISEADGGIYYAMNKGLAVATGDVVGFLNSDDFYTSPSVLALVAGELESDPTLCAVYGDVHFVSPDNLCRPTRYYSSRGFRRWKMRLGYMPAHPSFYARRSAYRSFGSFSADLCGAADFENMLRMIFIGKISTRYLPVDFVTMRSGGASTSGLKSHRRALADHMEAYRRNNVWSCLPLELTRYLCKGIGLMAWRLTHGLTAHTFR